MNKREYFWLRQKWYTRGVDCCQVLWRNLQLRKERVFWTVTKAKHQRIDAFKLLHWRRLEVFLDSKKSKPVHPKGMQLWISTGRTDAEAENPMLCPPDTKSWLIWKDPDAGKDWRWEKKGMTEDEIVGWHHWLDGHEFEQALGDDERQGSLACCSLWGLKESGMTEQLNQNTIDGVINIQSIEKKWYRFHPQRVTEYPPRAAMSQNQDWE